MDETQTLAVLALRELLDDPDRNDWDELVAATRTLIQAIETGEPMTRRNARIVAEYLREAGWQEYAIRSATAQAGAHADGRGPGSGRLRHRGRKTVESYCMLDVNQLSEKGCLQPGWSGTWRLIVGNECFSINVRAEAEQVRLSYAARVGDGGQEDVVDTISIAARLPAAVVLSATRCASMPLRRLGLQPKTNCRPT
jgi:hypothetical protein